MPSIESVHRCTCWYMLCCYLGYLGTGSIGSEGSVDCLDVRAPQRKLLTLVVYVVIVASGMIVLLLHLPWLTSLF